MFGIEARVLMTPRLRWPLFALAVLLLLAMARAVSGPKEHAADSMRTVVATGASAVEVFSAVSSPEGFSTLPSAERAAIKSAARDPFLMPAPAPTPLPTPVFTPPPPVLAASVMPREPVLQLSFTGRMQTPDGRTVVLAQWSDGRPVTLEQGKVLSNGYRVERMDARMVELLNPQTQAVVQLPLPPAPRFETR